jgi:hypothetical protein
MENNKWRDCFEDGVESCKFATRNSIGTSCCTIDHVVGLEWHGCVPQEIINGLDEKIEAWGK